MSKDIPYNKDYHCDLFDDLATVELNDFHNETNQSDDFNDSSNQSSDNFIDAHHPIDDFTSDDRGFISNPRSSQFDAAHTFQVKLHDLIMTHNEFTNV
jgi:hypothetical protein